MKQYLELLQAVKEKGTDKSDRTGTGTRSLFGHQMRIDLSEGFPLLTTKKVFLRGIIHELLWFLSGSTNIKYLVDNDIHIWDEWPFQTYINKNDLQDKYPMYSDAWKEKKDEFIASVKEDKDFAEKWGELGPVYGKQWIRWAVDDGTEVNQIKGAQEMIKNSPDSRRIIVSGWNVGDLQKLIGGKVSAPPPCHMVFQFYVLDGKLSCQLYQRSADVFLGVPFNIASYSLLTMMMAKVCGLEPGDFIHTLGDVHIYKNHFDQVDEQLSRKPRKLPEMKINSDSKDMFNFKYEDFELIGYDPYPTIKAPIAV